ncbi:MAG: polyhydroxybutyrate depolymerase [Actinomycetota bacterium]|nr:polyhydroxybutyrate depolymerase [Actinomycetota bacterium]
MIRSGGARRALVIATAFGLAATACQAPGRAQGPSRPKTTTTTSPTLLATTTPVAPPCSPARPKAAGQETVTLSFDGKIRDYVLRVPTTYDGTKAAPVIFDFHGWGSTGTQQLVYGSYSGPSDRDGVLLVAPNGIGQGHDRHFNIALQASPTDDVAFVRTILDQLEARLCIDPSRVFSSGMSDGGAMTSALACRASDRFAAFGPVAAVLYGPTCTPPRPVPIAAFMGNADPVIPFNGGAVHCCGAAVLPAAPDSMAGWAAHNHCGPPAEQRLSTNVLLRVWAGCADGGDVRFYIIEGGGHTWPGSIFEVPHLGVTTKEISASETLWAFFQAHPLPARAS